MVDGQDTILDVLGVHAIVSPDGTDNRNINFRKNIDGHTQSGAYTQKADHDKRRGDRIGAFQNIGDYKHTYCAVLIVSILLSSA